MMLLNIWDSWVTYFAIFDHWRAPVPKGKGSSIGRVTTLSLLSVSFVVLEKKQWKLKIWMDVLKSHSIIAYGQRERLES